jgi:hypothetical protein
VPGGKTDAVFDGKEHIVAAEFLRIVNRGAALEVKHHLPAMILAQPASFNLNGPRLGRLPAIVDKRLSQACEPLREIGQ